MCNALWHFPVFFFFEKAGYRLWNWVDCGHRFWNSCPQALGGMSCVVPWGQPCICKVSCWSASGPRVCAGKADAPRHVAPGRFSLFTLCSQSALGEVSKDGVTGHLCLSLSLNEPLASPPTKQTFSKSSSIQTLWQKGICYPSVWGHDKGLSKKREADQVMLLSPAQKTSVSFHRTLRR